LSLNSFGVAVHFYVILPGLLRKIGVTSMRLGRRTLRQAVPFIGTSLLLAFVWVLGSNAASRSTNHQQIGALRAPIQPELRKALHRAASSSFAIQAAGRRSVVDQKRTPANPAGIAILVVGNKIALETVFPIQLNSMKLMEEGDISVKLVVLCYEQGALQARA
jgi:hypothetical protein